MESRLTPRRTHRLDPLTMRVVALDSEAGANLLAVAPLPRTFRGGHVPALPAPLRPREVHRIPTDRRAGALTFGSTAHAAFETFTRERRERLARGEPSPTREDLEGGFATAWQSGQFEGQASEEHYRGRSRSLIEAFWAGELASLGEAVAEEVTIELPIEVPGGVPAVFTGSIDRLPSDGIEIVDYKTGRVSLQESVGESLQLTIYALASRDALGLGTPERVTLYFRRRAHA